MIDYNPYDWYWIVADDDTKAWSSKQSAYVNEWPADQLTKVASEQTLTDVLAVYKLAGPIPRSKVCSAVQGRLALKAANLLSTVISTIDTLPEDDALRIYWEYAVEWHQDSPQIATMAAALSLTEQQVDELFSAAIQIN